MAALKTDLISNEKEETMDGGKMQKKVHNKPVDNLVFKTTDVQGTTTTDSVAMME